MESDSGHRHSDQYLFVECTTVWEFILAVAMDRSKAEVSPSDEAVWMQRQFGHCDRSTTSTNGTFSLRGNIIYTHCSIDVVASGNQAREELIARKCFNSLIRCFGNFPMCIVCIVLKATSSAVFKALDTEQFQRSTRDSAR